SKRKEYDAALSYFHKNLELEPKISIPTLTATNLGNIGNIYMGLSDFHNASSYFHQAIEIAEENNLKYPLAVNCVNLGSLYHMTDDLDQAEYFYNKAMSIQKEIGYILDQASCMKSLATVYLKQDKPVEALSMIKAALELAEPIDSKITCAEILLAEAEILFVLEKYDEQIDVLMNCLKTADENDYKYLKENTLKSLVKVLRRKGNYKEALDYFMMLNDLRIDMLNEQRTQAIMEIKAKIEFQKKEHEAEIYRLKNVDLEEKNQQITRQKELLEQAESELIEWNKKLESRVQDEIEKRQQQERIILQKSKMEALGRLAAGIAHEINQPLGMINLGIQNMFNKVRMNKLTPEYSKEREVYFRENIERIKRIIEHVRLFSRDSKADTIDLFNVKDVINSSLLLIEVQCGNHRISIKRDFDDTPVKILGNKYRFEQVLLNLLTNAKDALEEKADEEPKEIIIHTVCSDNSVIITVEDNGIGIPAGLSEKIFEPFFTTKDENKGTGLGLSICYGIVQEMGGRIYCQSEPNQFTKMIMEFEIGNKGAK
ncbi:MAG: tetratricopeptide repeat protein, partial [Candidatus Cloacimonetes bacterium]|nr:tetratricopeptide repeat protein [Candidatus Cloacimonadota bacterium]